MFVIEPHFRLQEWVAEEKGYFRDEGLEYTFHEEVQKTAGQVHDKGAKVGAYQSLESGRASDGGFIGWCLQYTGADDCLVF